jgi:hypothetical protein
MDTSSKDFSQFLQTEEGNTNSQNLDANNTYKTILAIDPVERLRTKKKQGAGESTVNRLNYDEYTKGKPKEYRPEEVYNVREQAFVHMSAHIGSKDNRSKKVATFMATMHREMEERKIKERREELKKKINMKVPKKVNPEEYIVKRVI